MMDHSSGDAQAKGSLCDAPQYSFMPPIDFHRNTIVECGHRVATDEDKSFLVLAAGVASRTVRNTNLPGRQCCRRADPAFFNRANTCHLLSVCTVASVTHRIRRHLAVVHSVWRTFAPRNAVAEDFDWHFTHVISQVICLVTCGTGLRWTSRIQSTARKIGASLISRSRAHFNNGRWFG